MDRQFHAPYMIEMGYTEIVVQLFVEQCEKVQDSYLG